MTDKEIQTKLDEITRNYLEAQILLDQINFPLYDLVIYDYDGEPAAKFPLAGTLYEEHEGKLLVEYDGGLHTYRLDRFSYCTERKTT